MPSAAHRHWLPSRSEVSTSADLSHGRAPPARASALEEACDEARVDAPGLKFGIGQHRRVQGQIGLRRRRCAWRRWPRAARCSAVGAIRPVRDDLAEQRVVERRDARCPNRCACRRECPRPLGHIASRDVPGLGWKSLRGILGVDAAFDGAASRHGCRIERTAGPAPLRWRSARQRDRCPSPPRSPDAPPGCARSSPENRRRRARVDQELHRPGAAIRQARAQSAPPPRAARAGSRSDRPGAGASSISF